jgi:cobalamin-dependent methionine synthase I
VIIVGELINASREPIAQALAQRNAQAILDVAREQVAAGAHLLDINAGGDPKRETEDLLWLVDVVTKELEAPLCIDSPNFQTMEASLKRAGSRATMINSITGEKSRLESFLPLIETYGSQVIALCMGDDGISQEAQDRFETGAYLVETLTARGIQPSRIFLDPIISPVSVDPQAAQVARETLRLIKKHLPWVKTICGLSNISFGLPQRQLLNRNFLSLMLVEGLDAAILDPTDKVLMAHLLATRTLMGLDQHCRDYITAHREGKLS